jgi:CheY-like chemotaxis protein
MLFLLKVKPGNPKRIMESKQQITILIVDVTPINQKLPQISLEIEGYKVITVGNGVQARELVL